MIPSIQLAKQAQRMANQVGRAVVTLNGQDQPAVISRVTVQENSLFVMVTLENAKGLIQRVDVYDTDGDLLQTRNYNLQNSYDHKFVAALEIRVESGEINGA